MINENRRKWIDALRSGEYVQCKWEYKSITDAGQVEYCATGLAANVLDLFDNYYSSTSPSIKWRKLLDLTELTDVNLDTIMLLNDDGRSFAEIANYIEELP